MNVKDEPWSPADATDYIREIAKNPAFSIAYKLHAKERMAERSIISSDVLHVLKRGFVYDEPVAAEKSAGYFKYVIESKTPSSEGRRVRLVVIPNAATMKIKMVTVMWVDEAQTRAGTITEETK